MLDTRSAEQALPDADVIASILAGNTALYGVFVDRYDRLLRSTAGRIFRGAEDVPDVLQETHFRAYTHLADFKGLSSFSSWLTRIALNEALNRLRQRSRPVEALKVADGSDDVIARTPSAAPSPERQAMHQELSQSLREAVGGLPPLYRTVFVLKEVEELSVAEIVGRLGITASTVKSRVHRARKMLRLRLRAWEPRSGGFKWN
jgi:RNA polymerase sigma-70 factor (ECF subfamily)